MSAPFPSIQSFFQKEVKLSPTSDGSTSRDGDGFTASEVHAALNPLSRPWQPKRDYERCQIGLLETGPRDYKITGRVVNFSTTSSKGRSQDHYFLLISDGTGAIAIKLFYCKASDYQLLLGQRVTVWTSYISDSTKAGTGCIPYTQCATTVYPGRSGTSHIVFHHDSAASDLDKLWRAPIDQDRDHTRGLMTLKSFLTGGYDMGEGRLLVCVRSVGPVKTIHPKKREVAVDLVEVGIFDDTASCVLKLWGDKVPSAKGWMPNLTILLLSSPTYRVGERDDVPADVGIGYSSLVDVDPVFPDADWLRKKVRDMTTKERPHISFPNGAWDVDEVVSRLGRVLFTIAEVDEVVRQDRQTSVTGKLNVVLASINVMENWRKGTMCCSDCCGIPLYANKPSTCCKNCGTQHDLSLNPRIFGSFVDESGTISAGKLVWSDDAVNQLLFDQDVSPDVGTKLEKKTWQEVMAFSMSDLRELEESLLYSRVTLTFGWSAVLARLCIMAVEW